MKDMFWFVVLIAMLALAIGFVLGRKSKNSEIVDLQNEISHHKYQFTQCKDQTEADIHELRTGKIQLENLIQKKDVALSKTKSELEQAQARKKVLLEANSRLHEFYSATLEHFCNDGVLLPSVVRWSERLQEALDRIIVDRLESPPRPAPVAAEHVREARALARQWQREAELLRNRVDLYEAQAPWLIEYADYTVDEIIAGLDEEGEIKRTYASGDDPVKLFLTPGEWERLSNTEKNQLALDRYWEASRRRSAWAAGVQYERFIGYRYEIEGFQVEYHGAIRGKGDLGIDLICRQGDIVHVVQCKRLSVEKQIPVRENVVAQIYGAAMFYAMQSEIDSSMIKPVIVTTYELSSEARRFSEVLGVTVREHEPFQTYPSIKCNISSITGERIYHLPFDQQYDTTQIGNVEGEIYAMTVWEAEQASFRRALRWRGEE